MLKMQKMILKQFIVGALEDNNYLLIDDSSSGIKEAVLIDCTEKNPEIEKVLAEYGATLKYILLTHGHFDHVAGVNDFRKKYCDCKVLIHQNDQTLLDTMDKFVNRFGIPSIGIQKVDGYIDENQTIKFGENEIKIIHTPGHTLGGLCFSIGDKIFTGDTLFFEAVGRTDLPGGSLTQLKSSIQQKLFTLDENIKVYPGHGRASTIGYEKVNNKFL